MSEHADMTIGGAATVGKLIKDVGYNTHPGLDSLGTHEELVCLDCTRDLKFKSGICFISKELADALGMERGQRGQLVWIP